MVESQMKGDAGRSHLMTPRLKDCLDNALTSEFELRLKWIYFEAFQAV